MIETIMNGITNRIYEVTDGEHPIYTKNIRQNLDTPCFYVRVLNPNNDRFLGCRRHHQYTFSIQYIAGEEDDEAECYEMFEKLKELERISIPAAELEGKVSFENITDGVMTVLAKYDFYTYEVKDEQKMDGIEKSIILKG